MNFPAHFFDPSTQYLALLLVCLVLLKAMWSIQWRKLDARALNAWMGACVVLMLLWSLKGGFQPGLAYHLLGASAFTLLAGPAMALLGMAIVLAAVTAYGMADWWAFGPNFLVMAGVPVLITRYGLQLAQKHLPANYFIYIFFNAFFTGGVSMFCTGLSGVSTLALAGAYPVDFLFGDALAFYFLLSWSEAFTTGLLIAIVVVYKPHWIITFDDRRYLYDKKDGGG